MITSVTTVFIAVLLNQCISSYLQRQSHKSTTSRNAVDFSGARAHLRWTDVNWKSVLWPDHILDCFHKPWTLCLQGLRGKEPSRLLPVLTSKDSICDGVGVC